MIMDQYPYPPQQSYSSPASPEPYITSQSTMAYPPQQFPHPQKSYSLQVTTAHQSSHDPQEYTARPSNTGSSSLPFGMEPTPTQVSPPTTLSSQGIPVLDQGMSAASSEPSSQSAPQPSSAPGPGLTQLTRPLDANEQENLAHLDRLKFFLATAPSLWDASAASELADTKNDAYSRPGTSDGYSRSESSEGYTAPATSDGYPTASDASIHHDGFNFSGTNHSSPASSISADRSSSMDPQAQALNASHPHPSLNRFLLPSNEYVSCVLWSGLYHITGTDIVRALVFRFEAFGRPVRPAMLKKFEEGVFSDLRNLKPGVDASLEEPKSPFLDLLFKYQCIRTQKKQKVFYWFSVPHDRLFLDALERDLKREKMGLEPTTAITGEPALSFTYDPKRSLYEQFSRSKEGADLEASVRRVSDTSNSGEGSGGESSGGEAEGEDQDMDANSEERARGSGSQLPPALQGPGTPFFSMFSLFEGSPTYKQRRKKTGGMRGIGRRLDDERRSSSVDGGGRARSRRERFDSLDSLSGEVSAADAFMVQARGRRDNAITGVGAMLGNPDYFGNQHYDPMGASAQFPGVSGSMLPRSRNPEDQHRHTYPMTAPPGYVPHPYQVQRPTTLPLTASGSNNGTQISDMPADGPWAKSKAFACPLFSCGRMFKRMEHLKRHLRTHTMERPYTCPRCKKRFSRSDNLNQHLRTHTRGGSFDDGGGGSGVESELDDLEVGGETVNMAMYDDVQMCEVEVQGGVQDVAGDEEGLVTAPHPSREPSAAFVNGAGQSQSVYYPQGTTGGVQYANDGAPYVAVNPATPDSSTWVSRTHSSPAFGTSVPSPQPHHPSIPLIRSNSSRSSHNGSPASFLRQSHSSALPSSVFDSSVTSMSAPSHKQQFDHATLFPAEMGMDDGSGTAGPGPVRRHRSMTPSLMRDGPETIRRPLTAASMDFAGSGSGTPSGARGYHPYAMSAQSSPSIYPIQLDYQEQTSSGVLQDHVRSMMVGESRDVATDMYAPHPTTATGYGDIYRTDSPRPFQGPEYGGGSATQFDKQGALVSEPSMYGLSSMDAAHTQYVNHDPAESSVFFGQSHTL